MQARIAAVKGIARVIRDGLSLNGCLPELTRKVNADEQALLRELCSGTIRYYPALTAIIGALLDKPLKSRDFEIHALLACGLYQLIHTSIPDHAVVNESVVACAPLQRAWAKKLVNALLRRFIREREAIEAQLAANDEYVFAHPRWLIDMVRDAWPEQYRQILLSNNQRAPMTLRVNSLRNARDAYLATNYRDGSAVATAHSDVGVQLLQAVPVFSVPGFAEGLVSVQDEAAQLAAVLLDLKPGQRVLDACCAPGGKTCHIVEMDKHLSEVVAIDVDGSRLHKVRDNLQRLNLSVSVFTGDAVNADTWWDGAYFDRILLDAPCSASGVIRRHPDIKLLRKPEDVAKLARRQLQMLEKLWLLLPGGGKLLYATCSIFPAENDAVVEKFISSVANAQLIPIATEAGVATAFGRQLLPTTGGHDGFYYSLLQKSADEIP